jgi:hypothetical protein
MQSRTGLGWLMTTVLAAIVGPAACGGSTSGEPSSTAGGTAGTGGTGTNGTGGTAGTNGTGGTAGTNGTGGTAGTNGTGGTAGTNGIGGTAGTNGIGGTAGTNGTGGTAGTSGTGGSSAGPLTCTPVTDSRWSGGFVQCAEGYVHRVSAGECPLPARPPACDPSRMQLVQCGKDADCTNGRNGVCSAVTTGLQQQCLCAYGCTRDADCPTNQVCSCQSTDGVFAGLCVPAAICKTDAECAPGQCRLNRESCGGFVMQCVMPPTERDSCTNDRDCGQGYMCAVLPNGRACTAAGCGGIGRPFLVDGSPRLAPPVGRTDWAAHELASVSNDHDADLRARLAAAWTELGRMEHASIAAFARFTLELLAFGAPPALVEQAQAAMADETRHAKICFALASAYAGRAIGPGPLEMTGVNLATDLASSALTAFIEGCIGETVAAAEANEAAAHATDPTIAAVLAGIADDEARHAALAWRFIAWALASFAPGAKARMLEVLSSAAERALESPSPGAHAVELPTLGFLTAARRAELRSEVLLQVVRPCLATLGESADQTAVGSASIGI